MIYRLLKKHPQFIKRGKNKGKRDTCLKNYDEFHFLTVIILVGVFLGACMALFCQGAF